MASNTKEPVHEKREECIFCAIAARSIPAEVVYEDENIIAFLDIHPHAPAHTVVIPKTHAATLLDLPEKDLQPLFTAVKKITRALLAAVAADGMTIGINHGKAAGQAIPHLHVHLMPRFRGDGGGSLHSVVRNVPQEPLEKLAARVRESLQSLS
ncbi:HIT family protein [Candidatus Parcubacteria bacterium]|nr:MAG: HIT family protein [Candidatus Parcubacteria bacterium]